MMTTAMSAIAHERAVAHAARTVWPREDDQLHSKVERVQAAFRAVGRIDDARYLNQAQRAAWRKQKRLLVQEYGRKPMPYCDGDMTSSGWWREAEDAVKAAEQTVQIARQVLHLADVTGPAAATEGLIDAAYWAAHDALGELWEKQGSIPPSDTALQLFTRMEDCADELQSAKDDLVTWADAHNHTIGR